MKKLIIILLFCSIEIFSQEYEIAWEKDIGGSYAQFSKDGEFIYVAKGNTISKYRSVDGSFVSTFDGTEFVKNDIPIYGIFYLSGQGNYLLTCTDRFSIWDAKSEKGIRQIKNINCMDISADEKHLIIADKYSLFKTSFNDSIVIKSKSINEDIIILKLSHNGKIFATASISGTKYYLTLWDTETLTEIKRFELEGITQSTRIWDLKFSLDDIYVSIQKTTEDMISFYDISSLSLFKNVKSYNNISIGDNAFLSNGNFVLYYPNPDISEYHLLIYNKNSFELLQSFNAKSFYLASSANGLLFTGKYLLKPKTVGVSDPAHQNILISPNPADEYITIQNVIQSEAKNPGIEIFNIFGEKNLSPALSEGEGAKIKIDVSHLPAGIYFVRVGDKFEKFIKL